MAAILQPGIQAPNFVLAAPNLGSDVALATYQGQKVVLLFFPPRPEAQLVEQLVKFGQNPNLQEQQAITIGVSTSTEMELKQLAEINQLKFPLCHDPAGAIAGRFGLLAGEKWLLPAVFVLDEEGMIRRVYETAQYPALPNPAMVARALSNLAGVPKPPPVNPDDWQTGPADARVIVLEYADYECSPCGETYRLLKDVVPLYQGKVLWVHRHLPLRHSHPLAQQAAEAAEAAGVQGRFWDMHHRLFTARGALERAQLIEYAQEIGLNVERFTADLDSRRFREAVNDDFKEAVKHGIKLPPALFVNRVLVEGPRTKETICARIDALLSSWV